MKKLEASVSEVFDPVSTYRIQFHQDFTFSHLKNIIPYLDDLGIKTIYASPIFEATPGSTHGYDGLDPNSINPEIGTLEELREISQELRARGISWLQDIVPNHLAFHEKNRWLMDVLEKGKDSSYADYFDILWDHPDYPGRVMIPFPGSPLEEELKKQFPGEKNYVLCPWQETDHKINFRRFFLVNSLICTNIHLDHVFDDYHQLIGQLVNENIFQGVRIDHVDGLYDPTGYLNRLRSLVGDRCYIVVEKILEPGEQMPSQWPIQGNSGYDFLSTVNNLLTNRASEYELLSLYYDITGDGKALHDQLKEKKSLILFEHMNGELENLTRLYLECEPPAKDQDREELKKDIARYLIDCPVYRYYDNDIPVMERDRKTDKNALQRFYKRCMQFTGPLMAKGKEDTLMYTYNRFIGHNEVGDSPENFGINVDEFHQQMLYRAKHWPLSVNGSSTHDTKRGEDVRARLNVLTDLPEEWSVLVRRWMKENDSLKHNGLPDRNDEYYIYQSIAGSYPMIVPGTSLNEDEKEFPERFKGYLEKSLREAKVHSGWTEPNEEYESAMVGFANALMQRDAAFFKSFYPFFQKVTDYGMLNSFVQVVLKCTCPGVPDIYQGTELWDLSLVDPDNRRPVDYGQRKDMLPANQSWSELWKTRWNGQIKLKLVHQLLNIRKDHSDLFARGNYVPLEITGELKQHVVAFLRTDGNETLLVALPLSMPKIHQYKENDDSIPVTHWGDTLVVLPEGYQGKWKNLLQDGSLVEELRPEHLFAEFPAAVCKLVND